MRAAFLDLDDALARQPRLREQVMATGGSIAAARDLGPALRLWSRPMPLARLQQRLADALPASQGPRLVFAGSGDFHHVSPNLIARAIEATDGGPVTVVHLDNHPDWVRYANGLHCGSWVGAAARTPGVAKVVTVGVCSADVGRGRLREADLSLVTENRLALLAYKAPDGGDRLCVADRSWPTCEGLGLAGFITEVLSQITTENVYLTLDKDVLRAEDAATNWDQGLMSAAQLFAILGAVLERHKLIGADVVGDWSRQAFGGGLVAGLLKHGEAMLDQPWRTPANIDSLNEALNLRLAELFAKAA